MTAPSPTRHAETAGLGRFERRSALAGLAVLVGAVPFLLLWLLVQRSWSPLAGLDGDVAAGLNDVVSDSPVLVTALQVVTDLGGTGTAVFVLVLLTVVLVVRDHRRLAAFVATTGLGLAVLGPVTKAVVDRARPVVESPVVATPSNASFPSGHSMTALVTWGVVLLVALPAVHRRARRWLIAATVVVVVAVGFTRLALGVHFVSDVLAGWALGAGWLAATTASFRAWEHEHHPPAHEPLDPLDVRPDEAPHAAPGPVPPLPRGRQAGLRLLAVAAALVATLAGLGLLVTGLLGDSWVGRLDRAVVEWFVQFRSPTATAVVDTLGALAGTRTVVLGGLALGVLGVAVAASWRPLVFVAVVLGGEVLLYWATAQLVGRLRPTVADLTQGLPTGASWPSGHAAAAMALYGAAAALVVVHGRSPRRWWVLTLPLLVAPVVAVSRLYVAAHYPTDVLAGLVLGGVWVYACTRLLLAAPGRGSRAGVRRRAVAAP
ncbi:phosphatase PAP2 family protein [Geodermatophilus marinus]|uniref:phosphatase PAP2 family protein n=1 Tax=Geodermatophilus sp. LHW52908 TaxID=2303986 RepID=UPI0013143B31|nr:phosphatase PAP2 family protein [Geodermatophilus sp. LHW52908]